MICLLLALLCSACTALVLKAGDGKCRSRLAMIAANYVVCVLTGLAALPFRGLPPMDGAGRYALALGAVNGVLYLAGLLLYQMSIHLSGAILTASFMRLGVLVPVILSVLAFGERPSVTQAAGIALTALAIHLMAGDEGLTGQKKADRGSFLLLLALPLVGGTADSMAKVYERTGRASLGGWFLVFTFLSALILSVVLLAARKEKPSGTDVLLGVCLGVPNYLSSLFLLRSLSEVPAMAAYPVYSLGAVAVVALFSFLLFGERPDRREMRALAVILAAILLLNL